MQHELQDNIFPQHRLDWWLIHNEFVYGMLAGETRGVPLSISASKEAW